MDRLCEELLHCINTEEDFFFPRAKSLSFILKVGFLFLFNFTGVVREYVWLQVMFQTLTFVTAKTSKQSTTPAT